MRWGGEPLIQPQSEYTALRLNLRVNFGYFSLPLQTVYSVMRNSIYKEEREEYVLNICERANALESFVKEPCLWNENAEQICDNDFFVEKGV